MDFEGILRLRVLGPVPESLQDKSCRQGLCFLCTHHQRILGVCSVPGIQVTGAASTPAGQASLLF